jgi:ABC-type proline/glycine betaine transport system substrate-binding protein
MRSRKIKILLILAIVALLAGGIFALKGEENKEGKVRYADVSLDGGYIAIMEGWLLVRR